MLDAGGADTDTQRAIPGSVPSQDSRTSARREDLLIRRFLCGHPDLFRSVRYLGFAAARCSRPSGELQCRSSVWLPAWLPSAGHHHALVLVTTIGPLPSAVAAHCPAQAPPPNPIAAEPDGRRVLSGGGAADHEVTPQAPLTGSGCREHSYGGFGGGHPYFHPHNADLRITRVFPCVARGFKARICFRFRGCCCWQSSAVDGSSGASRGVRGHEKVPACGQVEVLAGGQLKVPTPRSPCRPGV